MSSADDVHIGSPPAGAARPARVTATLDLVIPGHRTATSPVAHLMEWEASNPNGGAFDFVIINAQGQTALIALVVGKPLVTQDFTWPRFTFRREVERAIGPAVLRAHRFVAEHRCVC